MNQLVFISYLTLLFDNLLLTMVVPIIPDYLIRLEYRMNHDLLTDSPLRNRSVHKFNESIPIIQSNGISRSNPLHAYAERAHRTGKVGILLAAHGFLQMIFNPIAGHSISRLGYTVSQTLGLLLLLLSAFVYSISERFFYLVVARGLHGIGSSFLIISAMSMIAKVYTDEDERCIQMGSTMSGIGAGVLIGYPYGGIIYQLFNKSTPFLIFIACLLVLLVTIGVSTMCIATLEPCLPIWLLNNFKPEKWELGMAFMPDSIGYLLGTKYLSSYVGYFGKFNVYHNLLLRWAFSKIALILVALSAIMIPLVTSIYQLILPHFALGLSIGAIDAAMMPMLAYVVDVKFSGDYGSVYAIAQIAVCTAYGLAPLLGSQLADHFGFNWLMRLLGIINLVQAVLIHFLVKFNLLLAVDVADKGQLVEDLNKFFNKIQNRLGFFKNAEYKEIDSSNS